MNCRVIIALLFATVAATAGAQERSDTVKVIENVESVVVTKKGDKTLVEASYKKDSITNQIYRYEIDVTERSVADTDSFPDNWGMDLPFMHNSSHRNNGNSVKSRKNRVIRNVTAFRHIYWGWRFNYGDKGQVKNCFELGIRDVIGVAWKRGGSELEIGLGIGMRRLLADDGYVYAKEGEAVRLVPLPEGVESKMSRLDIASFQIPVLYNQNIGKDAMFSIGAVLNFNTYAKAVTKTREEGSRIKSVYKGLHQNFLTPEITGAFYLGGVGIYAAWSPVALFKESYGPAVKAWSLGVGLFF